MRFTAVGLRVGFITFLYGVWTVVLWFNIPEAGVESGRFGGMAILWLFVTTGLVFGGVVFILSYLWKRAECIADWLNNRHLS